MTGYYGLTPPPPPATSSSSLAAAANRYAVGSRGTAPPLTAAVASSSSAAAAARAPDAVPYFARVRSILDDLARDCGIGLVWDLQSIILSYLPEPVIIFTVPDAVEPSKRRLFAWNGFGGSSPQQIIFRQNPEPATPAPAQAAAAAAAGVGSKFRAALRTATAAAATGGTIPAAAIAPPPVVAAVAAPRATGSAASAPARPEVRIASGILVSAVGRLLICGRTEVDVIDLYPRHSGGLAVMEPRTESWSWFPARPTALESPDPFALFTSGYSVASISDEHLFYVIGRPTTHGTEDELTLNVMSCYMSETGPTHVSEFDRDQDKGTGERAWKYRAGTPKPTRGHTIVSVCLTERAIRSERNHSSSEDGSDDSDAGSDDDDDDGSGGDDAKSVALRRKRKRAAAIRRRERVIDSDSDPDAGPKFKARKRDVAAPAMDSADTGLTIAADANDDAVPQYRYVYLVGGNAMSSEYSVYRTNPDILPRDAPPLYSQRSCYQYDVPSNRWTRMANLNSPRAHHACVVYRDVLYVSGGQCVSPDGRVAVLNSMESFALTTGGTGRNDHNSGKWIRRNPMHFPRHSHSLVVLNDTLFAIGDGSAGESAGRGVPIESYDFNTGRWAIVKCDFQTTAGTSAVAFV